MRTVAIQRSLTERRNEAVMLAHGNNAPPARSCRRSRGQTRPRRPGSSGHPQVQACAQSQAVSSTRYKSWNSIHTSCAYGSIVMQSGFWLRRSGAQRREAVLLCTEGRIGVRVSCASQGHSSLILSCLPFFISYPGTFDIPCQIFSHPYHTL